MKKLSAVLLLSLALPAAAQNFPTKPVHVIISFTPGSSTDIIGRIVIQKLSELWGQPVVPENRAGAGGSIGSAAVVRSEPDGYTLLIDSNAHCVTPSIYAKLPYDTPKDFSDIVPLAITMREHIEAMREWARTRARTASARSTPAKKAGWLARHGAAPAADDPDRKLEL